MALVAIAHPTLKNCGHGGPTAGIVMKNVIDCIHLALKLFCCIGLVEKRNSAIGGKTYWDWQKFELQSPLLNVVNIPM